MPLKTPHDVAEELLLSPAGRVAVKRRVQELLARNALLTTPGTDTDAAEGDWSRECAVADVCVGDFVDIYDGYGEVVEIVPHGRAIGDGSVDYYTWRVIYEHDALLDDGRPAPRRPHSHQLVVGSPVPATRSSLPSQ